MKKYILPLFFLSLILGSLVPNSVFAISSYTECLGENEGKTKSKDQLSAERAYVNRLFAEQAQRYEQLSIRKSQVDIAQGNLDSALGIQKPNQSLVARYRAELEVAQKAKADLEKVIEDKDKEIKKATEVCGANKADYDAAIKAMDDAVRAANNTSQLGYIPASYIPISPLPKDLIPGLYTDTGGYNLSNLIGGGFTLAIIIGVFLSVIMIIKHSLGYILSQDSFSAKKFSTERITEIVTGLVILLCSVVILRTIDPKIVNLTLESVTGGDKKETPDTPKKDAPEDTGTKTDASTDFFGSNGITPQMTYGPKVGGAGSKVGGAGATTTFIIAGGNSTTTYGGNSTTTITGQKVGVSTTKYGGLIFIFPGGTFAGGNGFITPNGDFGFDPFGNPIIFDPTLFCYQYRKKIDNSLLPRRCIIGFEACVLDKKQLEKTGLYKSFTQCKLKYSL